MGRKLFQIQRAGSKDWKYVFKYKPNCYRESLWDPFGALAFLFPSSVNDTAKVCTTANAPLHADEGAASGSRWDPRPGGGLGGKAQEQGPLVHLLPRGCCPCLSAFLDHSPTEQRCFKWHRWDFSSFFLFPCRGGAPLDVSNGTLVTSTGG